MTPKEKAIDIVDKFQCDSRYNQLPGEIAKIQALKAVDEMISLYNEMNKSGILNPNSIGFYLHEVKEEINKL